MLEPKWLKWILGGILLIISIVGGFQIERFFHPRPESPIHSQFNPVEYIDELRVIRYYYDAYIPITNKKEKKLLGLYSIPLELEGYIDFQEIGIEFINDSLVEIEIPEGKITQPRMDFGKTQTVYQKKHIWSAWQTRGKVENVYQNFADAIKTAKENAISAAKDQRIAQRTKSASEILLKNLYGSMGYEVRIERPRLSERRNKILQGYLDGLEEKDLKNLKPDETLKLFLELSKLSR